MLRKYNKINEIGHKNSKLVLSPGDYIVIEEKINGSNASFIRINDVLHPYGRDSVLDENLDLNGFYQWVKELNPYDFPEGVRFYGEWTCPQKVKIEYAEENRFQFFLFDVFIGNGETDTSKYDGDYLSHEEVREYAKKYGFRTSPVFYEGPYISLEHLKSFVGKSELGPEEGEGIVVKCHAFRSHFDKKQKWGKLVRQEFAERLNKGPRPPKTASQEEIFVRENLNRVRVLKIIQKLHDKGKWDNSFTVQDMGKIISLMAQDLWDDFYEEEVSAEPDLDIDKVKKSFNSTFPKLLRDLFAEELI